MYNFGVKYTFIRGLWVLGSVIVSILFVKYFGMTPFSALKK